MSENQMFNLISVKTRLWLYFLMASFVMIACNVRNDSRNEAGKNALLIDTLQSEFDLSGITIGYSTPSLNAPFYVVLSQYIEKYTEAYGMSFVMADGQDDIIKQITSMEDLITSGVDIMILNPLDHRALVPAVNAASRSGVPVFIVDSQIDETADYITSVQASNEGNGWLIGEWAINQLSNKDLIVALISGSQGNPVGQAKRLGFFEGFTESQLMTRGNSDLRIVSQGWGNWTLLGGIEAMEDILSAHPNVNLLVAENDAMAMGALKAIEESGKENDILVVGYDGQKEALELIMEGKYGATALNSPKELARLVVESVVRYKNGLRLDKVIHTPAVLITKDNVVKYYDQNALF